MGRHVCLNRYRDTKHNFIEKIHRNNEHACVVRIKERKGGESQTVGGKKRGGKVESCTGAQNTCKTCIRKEKECNSCNLCFKHSMRTVFPHNNYLHSNNIASNLFSISTNLGLFSRSSDKHSAINVENATGASSGTVSRLPSSVNA